MLKCIRRGPSEAQTQSPPPVTASKQNKTKKSRVVVFLCAPSPFPRSSRLSSFPPKRILLSGSAFGEPPRQPTWLDFAGGLHILGFPPLQVHPHRGRDFGGRGRKMPESFTKQNLNVPHAGIYLHSIYIVLVILSILETV